MAAIALSVTGSTFLPPESAPANAFGTTPAQGSEHQYITQVALGCKPDSASNGSCFEPQTLAALAGANGSLGAVGTPDVTEVLNPDQHCDNADYLPTPGYTPDREEATATLHQCIDYLRGQFSAGVDTADQLLTTDGATKTALPTSDADSARTGSDLRNVRSWRTSDGCCTASRTSTPTATGPTRRTPPAQSARTTHQASG